MEKRKRNVNFLEVARKKRYTRATRSKEAYTMSFGENLRFLRTESGMTQEPFAERWEVTRQREA